MVQVKEEIGFRDASKQSIIDMQYILKSNNDYLDLAVLLLVDFEHPVDNGYVPALDLEDNNLADPDVFLLVVGQEQQVTSLDELNVR